MPSYTAHNFPQFQQGLGEGKFNFASDTLKVALSNAAGPVTLATAGVQAAKLFTDWTSNVAPEITGAGYTAGGLALTGVTWTTTGDVTTLTCANPQWTGATFSANQAIVYDSTASTFQLICFWDFGGSIPVTDGPFTLQVNGSGLYTNTAS